MKDDQIEQAKQNSTSKNPRGIFCRYCECLVEYEDMNRTRGDDDETIYWSCPGCDDTLLATKDKRLDENKGGVTTLSPTQGEATNG